ncbi:MAG: formimidoylglutamate deiminase [Sandaracinaceae bacterium]|nr:formimidoylglutamate deiminase [Sandaracinaceae bacterium]
MLLPGLATAHSHAFQRALRGRAQRARGSFWSWRGLMYELASRVSPDDVHALSRFAFAELARAGVTAVGEFHYLHHQPDGTPYAERTALADAVIRAALEVGLRIALLRVIYERPGHGRAPEGAQRRFVDASLDDALGDVEALAARWSGEPRVRVGVAPHSVRAVTLPSIVEAARFAEARAMPLHMHVSEQRREIHECLAEHGARPVRLLADAGVLGPRFVAVHATHLAADEVRALGGSFACLCRTTERDLGDGLPPTRELVRAGARLCFGVDSHASSDPFEEMRAAELDERSRTERRALLEAPVLLEAASAGGYAAIGMAGLEREDEVALDARDDALAGARDATLDDAVVFGAGPRAVRSVCVGGAALALDATRAREEFERRLSALAL